MTTTSNKNNNNNQNNNNSPIMALNDDSLMEVLFRCRAAEHHRALSSLMLTCRRFRDVISSLPFRRERALAEWAEVSARILSPREMFRRDRREPDDDDSTASTSTFFRECYNDLGYVGEFPGAVVQCQVDFLVDGKKAGDATFYLVKRRNTRHFHEACDAISGDLQQTGCCFFDTKGRPRIPSVRDAIGGDKNDLLYISKVRWNPEYRRCSFVGAHALRSFLKDPKLQDKWAVAIYIPEAKEQHSEQDETTSSRMDSLYQQHARANTAKSQEEYAEQEAWEKRREDLVNIDMRQFLRAGFRQVPETVQSSDCKYAFAIPAYLNSPMLSANETEAIEILEKPAPSIQPATGANLDFLRFMKDYCSRRRELRQTIEQHESADLSAHAQHLLESMFESQAGGQFREIRQMLDQKLSEERKNLDRLEQSRSGLNEEERNAVESQIERCRTMLSHLEEQLGVVDRSMEEMRAQLLETTSQGMRAQSATAAANLKKNLEDLDSKVKEEIARFLSAGATVEGSFVLHVCAANRIGEYVDMLLENIPASKARGLINAFDDHGSTPLMSAAGVSLDSDKDLLDIIAKLLSLGADKDIVNLSGETALGQFRSAKRSRMDFRNTFGLETSSDDDAIESQIEALLLPSSGATAADNAYVDDPSSDEGIDIFMLGGEDDDDDNEDEDEDDREEGEDDEGGDDIDSEESDDE